MKIKILEHSSASYAKAISQILGKGALHARLLYKEWFQNNTFNGNHPHFKNAPKMAAVIKNLTDFAMLPLTRVGDEKQTEKFLLKTDDELEIEMVALPMPAGVTLCISSQIGCRMGCAFCETGKMGLIRSLSTSEIISQLYQAKHALNLDVRNIVFMGMGEPLDNYDAVMQAVKIMTDPHAFALGPSRISISTSGLVDNIYRLAKEAAPALNLAVSINAPNDTVRSKLMPVNHAHDMAQLKQAMLTYCAHPRRRIFAEYVLIQGKTDSLQNADELAAYLEGLNVTVNLIPYNPQSRDRFAPPDEEAIKLFFQRMKRHGYRTFIRGTKGRQIMAACGQLGNVKLRRSLRKNVSSF